MKRETTRTCSIDGCNRKHHAKGYCKKDYIKKYPEKSGYNYIKIVKKERLCSTEGCQKKHVARGYCGTCYRRLSRGGAFHAKH